MGTTFSTIQIRNRMQLSPEEFKREICKCFFKKGLIPATEKDAEYFYWLAFFDEKKWVTMGSGEYSSERPNDKLYTEIQEIAKELNTHCIVSHVWDSDFLELKLFEPSGEPTDTIVGGCPPCDEMLLSGIPEKWEPLLETGKTWEQLREISDSDYLFAEEALCKIAPLFGMNENSMTLNYEYTGEINTDKPNIIPLYFKDAKQPQTKKKPISLNAAFKQVFAEALAPLGFVKIKGRQPYFVRLIGNDIIHIITCMDETGVSRCYKSFNILGGVSTIYRHRISLDKSPSDNYNWLKDNAKFYYRSNYLSVDYNDNFKRSIHEFYYEDETIDEKYRNVPIQRNGKNLRPLPDIFGALKQALHITKQIMIPELDKAVDIDSCIEFAIKFKLGTFSPVSEKELEAMENDDRFGAEDLLCYLANDLERLSEIAVDNSISYYGYHLEKGFLGYEQSQYEELFKKRNELIAAKILERDKNISNAELYKKICNEIERRRVDNTEILRSYGLDV